MFEFMSVDLSGHEIAHAKICKVGAHAMLGALGSDVDPAMEQGNGDEWVFIDSEMSTAEDALTVAMNAPEGFTAGLDFLARTRKGMQDLGINTCGIIVF